MLKAYQGQHYVMQMLVHLSVCPEFVTASIAMKLKRILNSVNTFRKLIPISDR
jgi:hypothetical protein